MVAHVTNKGDKPSIQASYTRDYGISTHIYNDGAIYDRKKDWFLKVEFRCDDLLRVMREGLYWTMSNVVPEKGWLGERTTNSITTTHPWQRVWELREYANKPAPESRWVAVMTLYTFTVQTAANFRLDTLRHRNIGSCKATNKLGNCVFLYNRISNNNYNCFVDKLHPTYGCWWFWPMDAILDYDSDGVKTETESLI
jgi:hypothetical protein